MENSYRILYKGGTAEITIKKSRFIAHTQPVSSEQEALSYLAQIRKQYHDARHNCFAFVCGHDNRLQRFSDDGEPSGTAGKPILELLLESGIHDALIVVTRYFGGTLLGTGGLLRAYQQAAHDSLDASVAAVRSHGRLCTVRCDYNSFGKIRYLLESTKITPAATRYTEDVEIDLLLRSSDMESLERQIRELTAGRAKFTRGRETDFISVDGKIILPE